MRLQQWLQARRRAVLITATAILAVGGAVAVAVPAMAEQPTGYCNVNTGNLKVCVFRLGSEVWAGGYANPDIYGKVAVQLDGMTVKNYTEWPFTIFSTGLQPSKPNGQAETSRGNWKFGCTQYGVHAYLAKITAVKKDGSVTESAQREWIDLKGSNWPSCT